MTGRPNPNGVDSGAPSCSKFAGRFVSDIKDPFIPAVRKMFMRER
jgi:hypothetical protein